MSGVGSTERRKSGRDGFAVTGAGTYLGIGLVYAWRYTFGLLTPANTCKFHPSCSQYALDALRRYGLVKGSAKAAWRLLRCHPWSHGGVDPA